MQTMLDARPRSGNGSHFCPVDRPAMEAVLLPQSFREIEVRNTAELVFAKAVAVHGNVLSLRVLTSVNRDGSPRPAGQDAIRIQLWARDYANGGRPFKVRGFTRVMRVDTWAKNLNKRIGQALKYAFDLPPNIYVKVAGTPSLTVASRPDPDGVHTAPAPSGDKVTVLRDGQPDVVSQRIADLMRHPDRCPRCGAALTAPKQGRKGIFRGCTRFPVCRGLRDVAARS